MAVNVVHYRHAGAVAWGVVRGGLITPLPGAFATTGDFLRDGAAAARAVAAAGGSGSLPENQVELLSPITRNQQFVCQGINYRSHMRESGLDPARAGFNMIFRKASSCISPPHTDVVRPAHVTLLDYEVEIGLVIGAALTAPPTVTPETLAEVVAALVLVNDVSARDVQLPQAQFYKGKSYRTFGPVGPYLALVDAADLARFSTLRLRLWVNDQLRQDSLATDMVHLPAPTLTELSGLQDLFPGDLIATGTPGGCALQAPGRAAQMIARLLPEHVKWENFVKMNASNPRFLRPGDRMRAAIRTDDGAIDLGVQENRIV
ncbi:MAG: fumarylacetoacetate hydrolase family protein [Deltaproteobacteria bacterium]|nr:fumarylacetoacetate hydrolase family protein [Deltaproteobacteria bacterium]